MLRIFYNTETYDYVILFDYNKEYYIIKIDKYYRELFTVKDYTNTKEIHNVEVISHARKVLAEENKLYPLGLISKHGTTLQILREIQRLVNKLNTLWSKNNLSTKILIQHKL